jgi:hypothetical protein
MATACRPALDAQARAVLTCPPVLGALVFLWVHRLSPAVSATGLTYDILGVYWLAESLLVDELEANWLTTFQAVGHRGPVALRDGYQVRFALAVAFLGFLLQFVSDVV